MIRTKPLISRDSLPKHFILQRNDHELKSKLNSGEKHEAIGKIVIKDELEDQVFKSSRSIDRKIAYKGHLSRKLELVNSNNAL